MTNTTKITHKPVRDWSRKCFGSIRTRRLAYSANLIAEEWTGRYWRQVRGAPLFSTIEDARTWFRCRSNPCVSPWA